MAKEGSSLCEGAGNEILTKIMRRLCALCWVLPFGYKTEKISALWKGLRRPFQKLGKCSLLFLYSALSPSSGLCYGEDPSPFKSSWMGQGPSQIICKLPLLFPRPGMKVCTLHWVLCLKYMLGKIPVLQEGLGKGTGLPRTFKKICTLHWVLHLCIQLYSFMHHDHMALHFKQ